MSLSRTSPDPLVDVSRIDVLRANALGDWIFTLPALEAVRAAYPSAHLTLLGAPLHAELMRDRPGPVDEVVVVPATRGVRLPADEREEPAEQAAFFAARRQRRTDLALQLHGGGRWSNPFVRRLGARVTAGMQDVDAPPLDRTVPYVYPQREVLRLLEVVSLVGAAPVTLEPRLAVTDADREAAAELHPGADAYAVLAPGASDPRRRWPVDRFAEVGDRLAALGLQVLVLAGRQEKALADEVVTSMRMPATSYAGRTDLRALVGLLAGSSVVVANDSGPLHLAGAVGAATVGVYWCGNAVNAGPMTTARHRPVLGWTVSCPVCGRDQRAPRCEHDASYVADVPAAEVLALAGRLLGGRSDGAGDGAGHGGGV